MAGLAAVVAATGQPAAGAAPPAPAAARPAVAVADTETALVRLRLPDLAFLDRLVAEGADLAGRPRTEGAAVLADIVVTGREKASARPASAPASGSARMPPAPRRWTRSASCRRTTSPPAGRPSSRSR